MQREGKGGIKERSNRKKEKVWWEVRKKERGYCHEFREMPKPLARREGR